MSQDLSDDDYERLLAFRDRLRQFLHWSERQALDAGITPAQYQLLLAIRGHDGDPTVGEVADHLLLRHHSVVELIDRAELAGLVSRQTDRRDHRIVRVRITRIGAARLAAIATAHMDELTRLGPELIRAWPGTRTAKRRRA
jgi:DNA-binding MarR family transcriptional regulator